MERIAAHFRAVFERFKMNKFARFSLVPASLLAAELSHAAVDAAVTTALADMKADGLVVAGAVFIAIVAIAGFKLLKRAL